MKVMHHLVGILFHHLLLYIFCNQSTNPALVQESANKPLMTWKLDMNHNKAVTCVHHVSVGKTTTPKKNKINKNQVMDSMGKKNNLDSSYHLHKDRNCMFMQWF